MNSSLKRWWDDWRSTILIILGILIVRSSLVNWYQVPSGSMLPTILLGDRVLTNKLAYGLMLPWPLDDHQLVSWGTPNRGDIILFQYPKQGDPNEGLTFVKRVIGLAGETIEFRSGILHINGVAVIEEPDTAPSGEESKNFYGQQFMLETLPEGFKHHIMRMPGGMTENDTRSWTVPEGHVLVIGDNRDGSNDGRSWGFVETKKIYGKATRILFSTDPDDSFVRFRGSRTGRSLYDL